MTEIDWTRRRLRFRFIAALRALDPFRNDVTTTEGRGRK